MMIFNTSGIVLYVSFMICLAFIKVIIIQFSFHVSSSGKTILNFYMPLANDVDICFHISQDHVQFAST